MQPPSNYDTNSLRLITPRLCTYNVNVNRPYKYNNNINRMFITDMTYMPGYFIEQIPHKYYRNRSSSWAIGSRPVALPPGLTKAGREEKQELEQYIKNKVKNQNVDQQVGHKPIRVNAPSLRLKKGQYKRPLCMYDLDEIDKARMGKSENVVEEKPRYKIFPPLNIKKGVQPGLIGEVDRHRWNVKIDGEDELDEAEPGFTRRKSNCITSGKQWNMDRFKMWSGGTEGSVEYPKWSSLREGSAGSR